MLGGITIDIDIDPCEGGVIGILTRPQYETCADVVAALRNVEHPTSLQLHASGDVTARDIARLRTELEEATGLRVDVSISRDQQ